MDRLKQMLDTINITYNDKIFESEDGIAGLEPEPFVSELIDQLISCPRIYVMIFVFQFIHRIPTSEYTLLQPTLHMQDHCYVR